jgi:predicted O-methyltransferase YrrM
MSAAAGASTIVMALAFPNSRFVGSDYHDGSIETARRRKKPATPTGSASRSPRRRGTVA